MNDPRWSRPWWRTQLFRVLARIARRPRRSGQPLPEHPRRILVLLPVLRGDYLVATPLLAALRKARPHAEIAVMTTTASEDLARRDPHVDRVLLYRKLPGWPLSIVQLASYRPDVALLPKGHPAFTESLVLAICGARWRVGLSHPNLDRLLTHPVEHDWENEHRTTAFSRLLAPFGVDPASVRRRPHIGRDEEAEAWARRIANSKAVGRPLLTINLSASRGTRRWPIARWQQFITLLLKEYPGATILALSSPADHHQCVYLAETFFQVHTIATRSFLEAVSLAAQSDLLVTVDTGIVQGAAARGVPMVVLYNGDHEVYIRFAPESVPHRALLAPRGQPVAAIQERDVLRETLRMLQRFRRDRGA